MAVPITIPLFAKRPHPSVPLGRSPAGARSEGQGRPPAGATRAPFTTASTPAGWRRSGGGSAVLLAVLLLAPVAPVAMSAPALAQDGSAERTAAGHPYAAHVADAARRFGIPEAWIWAVMRVESNGDVRAVSTAGAMGLMQIMPATWTSLRSRYGLGTDPYDVRDNIVAGAAYLRAMHDRYGNTVAMLAAYNAGPGRYDEYLARGRPLPAETRTYVAKLAPLVGGSGDVQLASATLPDPFAWRRAALFAARPSDSPSASEATPDERPADSRTAVEPAAPGLFVTLSGQRQP